IRIELGGIFLYKVVIIGGGWSGCAAALSAKKAGAEVTLLEKTDLLLGLGNVGGIMRNNGRFTAAEENIALGAKELFGITDKCSRHVNIDFPGHKHASLYDVTKVEPNVRRLLREKGIDVRLISRGVDVVMSRGADESEAIIEKIVLAGGEEIEGDVFVETTGSTGPMGNCLTYGNGCCMCILRCPAFGPRVSISAKAGGSDIMGKRKDGAFGAFSGSGKLEKQSLSQEIQDMLNDTGVAVIPLPKKSVKKEKLDVKVCKQYALDEFAENIVLLDTGYAKIMTPFFDIETLRQVPGFEDARYVDPYAGGKGNSIRYLSVAERDNSMKVMKIGNLFCGGEKSGLFVGHTEAISTGSLAGHNAVRYLKGMKALQLPIGIAIGDLISFANKSLESEDGLMTRYTFSGAEYFKRMKEKGLYSVDKDEIALRIKRFGLENIYDDKLL
ncbi:MAG: FAD-dependent oxidoreductase, partial [Anaerovoracaceae bacterium]